MGLFLLIAFLVLAPLAGGAEYAAAQRRRAIPYEDKP